MVLPIPFLALSADHNHNLNVSSMFQWSDFVNATYPNGDDKLVTEYIDLNSLHGVRLSTDNSATDDDLRNTFAEARKFLRQGKRFTWALSRLLHQSSFCKLGLEVCYQAPGLPQPFFHDIVYEGKQKTGYPQMLDSSSSIYKIKDSFVSRLKTDFNPPDKYISFHVRGGDSIDSCDTSLDRILDYLSCSLKNEKQSLPIVLFTDETHTAYIDAVTSMGQQLVPKRVIVHGDRLLSRTVDDLIHTGEIPEHFHSSNYVVYAASLLVEQTAKAVLQLRRKCHCNLCDSEIVDAMMRN